MQVYSGRLILTWLGCCVSRNGSRVTTKNSLVIKPSKSNAYSCWEREVDSVGEVVDTLSALPRFCYMRSSHDGNLL